MPESNTLTASQLARLARQLRQDAHDGIHEADLQPIPTTAQEQMVRDWLASQQLHRDAIRQDVRYSPTSDLVRRIDLPNGEYRVTTYRRNPDGTTTWISDVIHRADGVAYQRNWLDDDNVWRTQSIAPVPEPVKRAKRWSVHIERDGSASFVENRYGHATQQEAKDFYLASVKQGMQEELKRINRSLNEITSYKKCMITVNALTPEPASQPAASQQASNQQEVA